MSDLSRMLDDLYAVDDAGAAGAEETPSNEPTWSAEESFVDTPTGVPAWSAEEPFVDIATAVPAWSAEEPFVDTPTRAPAWSSEEALDDVFASWIPGSSDDAPERERSLVAAGTSELVLAAPELDTWRQDTEPVAAAPVVERPARWTPSDDDILPARRRGRRSVRP